MSDPSGCCTQRTLGSSPILMAILRIYLKCCWSDFFSVPTLFFQTVGSTSRCYAHPLPSDSAVVLASLNIRTKTLDSVTILHRASNNAPDGIIDGNTHSWLTHNIASLLKRFSVQNKYFSGILVHVFTALALFLFHFYAKTFNFLLSFSSIWIFFHNFSAFFVNSYKRENVAFRTSCFFFKIRPGENNRSLLFREE